MKKQPFLIFKAGKYPQGDFSDPVAKEIFESYDPGFLSAPFTVDHQKSGPMFGHAKAVEYNAGNAYVDFNDIDEKLRANIPQHWRRTSVEFYKSIKRPDGSMGPYLRAISFLGVKKPAIEGMEGVNFEDVSFQDAEYDSIDFTAATDKNGDPVFISLSEAQTDGSVARVLFECQQREIARLQDERDEAVVKFSTTDQERRQAEERIEAIRLNERKMEFERFLNERIAYGSVLPDWKQKIMDLLLLLDSVADFSDQNSAADTPEAPAVMMDFLKGLPKYVEFKEIATGDDVPSPVNTRDAATLAAAAVEFQAAELKKGVRISVTDAVRHIQSQSLKS